MDLGTNQHGCAWIGRTARRAIAFAGLVCLASACASSRPAVDAAPPALLQDGRYSADSDWPLSLELLADGRARIETTWWGAQGSRLRSVEATWTRSADGIEVRYGGVTDRLRFDTALAAGPEPGSGSPPRPGLESLPPIHRKSLIGLTRLWIDPATR